MNYANKYYQDLDVDVVMKKLIDKLNSYELKEYKIKYSLGKEEVNEITEQNSKQIQFYSTDAYHGFICSIKIFI